MATSEAQKKAFHKYYEKTNERDRQKVARYKQKKLLKLQENK